MPIETIILLVALFFIIALFYASAGLGGGSSYLAVLALFPLEFTSIRAIALLCNITVVTSSVYLFYKSGFLKFRKVLSLIILSIPMAYLGGSIAITQNIFFILLSVTLILAAISMIASKDISQNKLPRYSNGIIGGTIGFLSGMVGIGGGIFLSPVLHLSKWDKPRVIAATTALFILVNSMAGLTGQVINNEISIQSGLLIYLILAVFLGGQIGSRLTIKRFNPLTIKKITAFLIFILALRILYKQFI